MDLLYTAHIPEGEGPFPTILALHGWGASAHDLIGLAPILHGGRALVLCPQGPVTIPVGQGLVGFGWFPISEGGPPDLGEFDKGRQALARFLEQALERYPIDRRKLMLLGFSQGGVMAYDLALREPERFAALIALSSWLPPQIAAGIPRRDAHEQLPTLVMHGSQDPMIPLQMGRSSIDELRKLGVPASFREYDMEHEIRPEALRDLVGWLEDQISPIQLA